MLNSSVGPHDTTASAYANYFDIVRADSPLLLDAAYRLRYQVYCIENPFENAAEHLDGRERDEDDDRSVHALLVHRRTGAFAGTVRAILPCPDDLPRPLPIDRILAEHRLGLVRHFPPDSTAEISRFAVSKAFRRRQGEERYADVNVDGDMSVIPSERRMIPYITFGLIRAVVEICTEHGVTHICAVMEPALIRILSRFGLEFQPIGGLVEHHGWRQPCVARLDDLLEHSRSQRTPLWQYTAAYAVGPNGSRAAYATRGRLGNA